MKKLFCWDVDGTLVKDYKSAELMPQVVAYVQGLRGSDTEIALVSNQGGVGFRLWGEANEVKGWQNYPTEAAVRERLAQVAEQIEVLSGIRPRIYCAFQYKLKHGPMTQPDGAREWSYNWRKPNGGMICQAMADTLGEFETVMVGDFTEDEFAAGRAGCKFVWASDFFVGSHEEA